MRGLKHNAVLSVHDTTVASFTDAWIETGNDFDFNLIDPSHLLQMRGLKLFGGRTGEQGKRRIFYRCVDWNRQHVCIGTGREVASFTDAWIETPEGGGLLNGRLSHLLQMRGLKRSCTRTGRCILMSHLLQMRGLKLSLLASLVAPGSRIFYRCVDWNRRGRMSFVCWRSRIFYRCVDWNRTQQKQVGGR